MIREKIEKHLNYIIIVIAFALVVLAIACQPSNAASYPYWDGNENGGMPRCQLTPPTGLFPQLLNERQFSGKADTEFPYEEWTTDISTGVVYCANQGTILRFGTFDPKIYYADTGSYMTGKDMIDWFQEVQIKDKAKKEIAKHESWNVTGISITVKYSGDTISWGDPYFAFPTGGSRPPVEEQVKAKMINIFKMLAATSRPPDLYGSGWENYNHQTPLEEYDGGSAEFGPRVCVMESKNRARL